MHISDPAALAGLRAEIDVLDREIVPLLARRAQVVARVTELKHDEEAVRSTARVEEVIERVRGHAVDAGMDPEVAETTYRALIDALTACQLRRLGERTRAAGDVTR